jgi:hypothetical protein
VTPHFDNARIEEHPAKVSAGINDAIATEHGAGINHGITADFSSVSDKCSELRQTGSNRAFLRW